jgi:hypothetical protein
VSVDPNGLAPTQDELDSFKVGLAATGKLEGGPPIVSSDNYVIDGHHHWAGAVVRAQSGGNSDFLIHRLGETRDNLLSAARSYDTAHGIAGEGIADKLLGKYSDDQPRDEHGRWTDGGGADVLFEVSPNPDNAALATRWNELSDSARAAVTDKISGELTPQVMSAIGAQGTVEPALGGFEGEVNPALVMSVNEGDPFAVAGAIGDTFGQKAMVVMSDKPMEGLSPVGMVSVSVPGASADTLRGMQGQIGDLADGFTYRNGQMQILNFSGQSNEDFAKAVDARLNGAYVVGHAEVYSAYVEAKDYDRPAK